MLRSRLSRSTSWCRAVWPASVSRRRRLAAPRRCARRLRPSCHESFGGTIAWWDTRDCRYAQAASANRASGRATQVGAASAAGQMDYGGVGGDHEIQILDQCGRIDHRCFQVEALRQIFDRKADFRQLLQPVPLLQTYQAHSRNFCQGREVGQRNGTGPVAAVLRIALPMNADPERRAVAAEAISPGADEGLVGGQIGDVGGNRIEVGLEDARQREQRRLHVDGRRRLSFVEEGHARQIEVRARLEDRNPARRAGDDDFAPRFCTRGA